MCGIAGCVEPGLRRERWTETLTAMAESLRHRGPDDQGIWFDAAQGVGLANRRLAILDLSPRGHQPMASSGGRYTLTHNGEIYNFVELRRELLARGHAFGSDSDTEVMLAAFVEWGVEAAIERFNGMFAFAVWDRAERRLHLVRDRLGEKPLYYGWLGGAFAFASELKSLAAHPAFDQPIDRVALARYLAFGYVPTPRTIYEGVAKLPPGAMLTLSPADSGRAPSVRTWWDALGVARQGAASPLRAGEQEAAGLLEEALRRAVRLRLVSDVPLGAFLSGGIDSSLVVALMQGLSAQPVRTFTIGFSEGAFDEAPQAREVARHLGTDHTELYLSAGDALEVIPRLPDLYDEPFADSSQIPTFLVSELASRHVTVALSGDGGDELFGGYNRYRLGADLWRSVRWLPAPLRRRLGRLLAAVPPALAERGLGRLRGPLRRYGPPGPASHKLGRLAEVLEAGSGDDLARLLVLHWRHPADLVLGLPAGASVEPAPPLPSLELEQRMMALDLVTYLPDDILVKLDRAAMGVSLETRVPLLDPDVVALAWRLPLGFKRRGGQGKWLLRQVLYRHVPRALVERPKQGFGVPIGEWLKGPLRDWAEDLLATERLTRGGLLRPEPIRRRWEEHLAGRRDGRNELWDVLVLQQWLAARECKARPAAVASAVVG